MADSMNVVSNRLPIALEFSEDGWVIEPGSGGLVQAMRPLLERGGGRWIGWPGTTEPPSAGWPEPVRAYSDEQPFDLVTVPQSADEHDGFYAGFANRVLWPLFHGLLERCEFRDEYWEAYRHMNRKFAGAISKAHSPGDVTWVHDYHLMGVPNHLDESIATDPLGFFLHIPFPQVDTFQRLPWSGQILDGLLGYDLVGFQTERDVRNFARAVRERTGARVGVSDTEVRIDRGGHRLEARAFPISCDFDAFDERASSPDVAQGIHELDARFQEQKMLLGVDRLDYTKGLPERLAGYERTLEKYPELRENVVLYQLVVPSRECVEEYRQLRDELERTVGRIQGRFATSTWQPIQFRYTSVDMDELSALYRYADAALVTPLRDGMNLVAKEYCASQVDEDGVLILSGFAGAAEQLAEGAAVVNPHDTDEVADSIFRALRMGRDERTSRMQLVRDEIERTDVYWWADTFLEALSKHADQRRIASPSETATPTRPSRP